jgi:hypothetical protein
MRIITRRTPSRGLRVLFATRERAEHLCGFEPWEPSPVSIEKLTKRVDFIQSRYRHFIRGYLLSTQIADKNVLWGVDHGPRQVCVCIKKGG